MKKHSDETIIKILHEAEGELTVRDVCRKHQITEQTFYRWRNKFGGMNISEAKRLRELERENAQLKQIVADLTLDNRILTDVNKKVVSLPERRRMVEYAKDAHAVSERRACQVLSLHRSTYRYQPIDLSAQPVYQRVIGLSEQYDYWGYRKITDLVHREGLSVGRERVREIRKAEGLQVPGNRPKRRRRGYSSLDVSRAEYPGHVWSYDFIFDQTADGKTLKFLTIVDEYTRVCLAIPCGRSMTGGHVIRNLSDLIRNWDAPKCIRSDNGSEFVAHQVKKWIQDNGIDTHYIHPGSPWENPFVESFNSIFRTTFLNRWCFLTLAEARALTVQWHEEYNLIRPHGSLAGLSPLQFLRNFRRDNPKLKPMTIPENLTLKLDQ